MLVKIFNYFIGYVEIVVTGTLVERFINICIKNGIYLWNIQTKDDGVHMCVSRRGFLMLKDARRKSKCHVKIISKKGFYKTLHRHKKRKFLVLGFVLCMAMLLFLSSFIWVVRIEGNVSIKTEDIVALIDTCGLRRGVIKYKINPDAIQQKAMYDEPRLAWLWVDVSGTVAHVKVKERVVMPPPIDVTQPCDVIASQSGVIRKMIVRRGNALCAPGDTVYQGQVLVSAYKDELTPVHADADIVASVWYERELTYSLNHEVFEPTGKTKTKYTISFWGNPVNLWFKDGVSYKNYTEKKDSHFIRLWQDMYLPIEITRHIYTENNVSIQRLTKEQAVIMAQEEITKAFIEEIKNTATIVEKSAEVTEIDADTISVKMIFECHKPIDLQQAAEIPEINEPEEK